MSHHHHYHHKHNCTDDLTPGAKAFWIMVAAIVLIVLVVKFWYIVVPLAAALVVLGLVVREIKERKKLAREQHRSVPAQRAAPLDREILALQQQVADARHRQAVLDGEKRKLARIEELRAELGRLDEEFYK